MASTLLKVGSYTGDLGWQATLVVLQGKLPGKQKRFWQESYTPN